MNTMTSNYFLKRLGVYENLQKATINYANITFRIVGGVLGGLPLEAVSFFTTIERLIWLFMEIPGGWIADRWGRMKTAICGYILMIFGNFSLYCAYLAHTYAWNVTPFFFLALMGVFIGIGGPLISGSVVAYYQEAYENALKQEGSNKTANDSFSLSAQYGKYLPILYVFVSFIILYICHQTIGAGHCLIFFSLLTIILLAYLIIDVRKFGDPSETKRVTLSIYEAIQILFKDTGVRLASFLDSNVWLFLYVLGYYALISLGREVWLDQSGFFWIALLGFTFFSQGVTPILVGYALPKLIKHFTQKTYLLMAFCSIVVLSLLALLCYALLNETIVFLLIFMLYGAIVRIPSSAIARVSNNMALKNSDSRDYSTVLSIKLMPAQIIIFAYSMLLTIYSNGAPSIFDGLLQMTILAFLSGTWIYFFSKHLFES